MLLVVVSPAGTVPLILGALISAVCERSECLSHTIPVLQKVTEF